ncbi:MAG: hypothetical protein ABI596_01715 [Pyrinomonadaceae bacterium]
MTKDDLDKQYRAFLTLWGGMFLSFGTFFLFTLFTTPGTSSEPGQASNKLLVVASSAVGSLLVVLSFAVKRKLLQRSVEKQDVGLVQRALIVASVMCEVCVLIGMLQHLLLGNREYYLLFLVAAVGMLLHLPRRDHLLAATYKTTGEVAAS